MALFLRSGGHCERCGVDLGRTGIERHHRMRRRDGGDRLANLLYLCPGCHQWCHAHPAASREGGWIVPTWADPAATAVLLGTGGWWTLDDLGGRSPAEF